MFKTLIIIYKMQQY